MGRFYCDYCDAYLTHDSRSVRKQHCAGFKHKANVRAYYAVFQEQLRLHEERVFRREFELNQRRAFQASFNPQFQQAFHTQQQQQRFGMPMPFVQHPNMPQPNVQQQPPQQQGGSGSRWGR